MSDVVFTGHRFVRARRLPTQFECNKKAIEAAFTLLHEKNQKQIFITTDLQKLLETISPHSESMEYFIKCGLLIAFHNQQSPFRNPHIFQLFLNAAKGDKELTAQAIIVGLEIADQLEEQAQNAPKHAAVTTRKWGRILPESSESPEKLRGDTGTIKQRVATAVRAGLFPKRSAAFHFFRLTKKCTLKARHPADYLEAIFTSAAAEPRFETAAKARLQKLQDFRANQAANPHSIKPRDFIKAFLG